MENQRHPAQKRQYHVSTHTKQRAEAAKAYIEQKYSQLKKSESEKKTCWNELSRKMKELALSVTEQQIIKQEILHKEAEDLRAKRARISIFDFEDIAIIGKGAFGQVRVVRYKPTSEIFALKKMNKKEMVNKNQVQHIRAQRNVLATADNPWIVDLKFSFQDEKYLYLVMEYLAGGDLMNIFMVRDRLPQDESRFYIAETILAVQSVHQMNYIHRDLKPDNLLIDNSGHVKLSDFGLCKHTQISSNNPYSNLRKLNDDVRFKHHLQRKSEFKRSRKLAFSTVGTPDYIAPQVLQKNGYTQTADWWSIGAILFQMLVGYPPFFSDQPNITCQKILHWRKTLKVPDDAGLSIAATDLIRRLMCDAVDRLGTRSVQDIKNHPFFLGVNWQHIRQTQAPWVPMLTSEIDTSNFDKFDQTEPFYPVLQKKKKQRKDVNFIGYTYKKDLENQRNSLVTALEELESIRSSLPR